MLGTAHIEKVEDDNLALSGYRRKADDLPQGFESEHVRGDARTEYQIFSLGTVVLLTAVEHLLKCKSIFRVASACDRPHFVAEIAGSGVRVHGWTHHDFASG